MAPWIKSTFTTIFIVLFQRYIIGACTSFMQRNLLINFQIFFANEKKKTKQTNASRYQQVFLVSGFRTLM